MKKRASKMGRRFKATAYYQALGRQPEELDAEELALYVRRAEEEVLPIIKELNPGPATAQFLLAQQTRVLVTGDPRLTAESRMAIANAVLRLWKARPKYWLPLHTPQDAPGPAGRCEGEGRLRSVFSAFHTRE